ILSLGDEDGLTDQAEWNRRERRHRTPGELGVRMEPEDILGPGYRWPGKAAYLHLGRGHESRLIVEFHIPVEAGVDVAVHKSVAVVDVVDQQERSYQQRDDRGPGDPN